MAVVVLWGGVQTARAFPAFPLIMIICTNTPPPPFIPTWQFLPPADPPQFPMFPLSPPPIVTPANGPSGPLWNPPPDNFPSGPPGSFRGGSQQFDIGSLVGEPQATAVSASVTPKFSIDSAIGNGTNWNRYEDGAVVGNGDTIHISFDPLLDYIETNWLAFRVTYSNGSNTASADAIMPAHCSIGSWTIYVSGTNPVVLAVTNVACRPSIGLRLRNPLMFRYSLPKGVDAVAGSVEMPLKIAGITNGEAYTVEYKMDYELGSWTTMTNIVSDSYNTDNYNVMNFDLSSGGATQLFLRIRSSDDCSSVIGYSTINVGAQKKALVANQFSPTDARIPALFAGATTGSCVIKYTDSGWVTNWFDGTTWSYPAQTLLPGEGAFFYNSAVSDVTLTFSGLVLRGGLASVVGTSGFQSYLFPKICNLGNTRFPADEGDVICKYYPYTDSLSNFTFTSGMWLPSAPEFAVGEAFAIGRTNSVRWAVSSEQFPTIAGPFGLEIYDYMHNDVLPSSSLTISNGFWDTSYFLVRSRPGITWDVQTASDLAGPWTTEAVAEVGSSQVAVVQVSTEGRQQLLYRLKWPSEGVQQRMMSMSLQSDSSQTSGRKAGMVEELKQLLTDVESAEASLTRTNYYLLSLGEDGPPIPGNELGLPEFASDGNIVVLDDRKIVRDREIINQGKAAAVFMEIQRNLARPLPSWLQKH